MQYKIAWPPLTQNTKTTIIGLAVIFLVTVAWPDAFAFVQNNLLVSAPDVVQQGKIWTLLSYAFFHQNLGHLLFNGLALWMFAGELDQRWSSGKFWTVSLLSALGGGVAVVLTQLVFSNAGPTLGYSGAVMGLIAAFAWYNWDRRLNFFFFPMTGRTFLAIIVGIDLIRVLIGGQPVSISAHIGGMLTGLLLVSDLWKPRELKRRWQRRSMKKKFREATREVDRKRDGRWIN